MATFGELQELVRRDIERTDISADGNASLADDTIKYYLLAAMEFFQTESFTFNQASTTLSITASSETVALPSDFAQFTSWRITTSGYETELCRINYPEIENMRVYDTTRYSKPTYFAIYGDNLEVFPTPSSTLSSKFSYIKKTALPSADSDSGAWVNEARMLIAAKAKEYIYTFTLEDVEQAQLATIQVAKELDKLAERNIHHKATGFVRYSSWL